MTKEEFETQLTRLSGSFGIRYYQGERAKVIWDAIHQESHATIDQAFTRLLQTQKTAPMVPEMLKAIEAVHAERKQREREYQLTNLASPLELLEQASNKTSADKDFVQACLRTLRGKLDGTITGQAFLEACEALDSLAKTLMRSKRSQEPKASYSRNPYAD
jgi:hypothetical protein